MTYFACAIYDITERRQQITEGSDSIITREHILEKEPPSAKSEGGLELRAHAPNLDNFCGLDRTRTCDLTDVNGAF
jgi:hypothetical protein